MPTTTAVKKKVPEKDPAKESGNAPRRRTKKPAVVEVAAPPQPTAKQPFWYIVKKPWVKYAAIGLTAIAIGAVIAVIHRNHEQKQKAETVRRKKELLDQVINVINAKIEKQDTVILTDRQSAEVYRNDRVAFEHAMKDMRTIDLDENKKSHEKFDSVGSDDALRQLIDQLLTANE